ncbi:MAG: bifunctional DNA primase/polymerase, partial [Lentisphaerota bacterium]
MNRQIPVVALLETALGYANAGIPIFPCEAGGKKPLTEHGFKDASTNLKQIEEWWSSNPRANIGIPTGPASELFGIDVDNKDGKEGLRSLWELTSKYGQMPMTLTVETPSGGFHFFFKWRDGLRCSAGKLGLGLDTRGEGGYLIAAGSSIDGKRYNVVNDSPVAELPTWLVQLLNPAKQSRQPGVPSEHPDAMKVTATLNFLNSDCCYDDWRNIGMALHSWNSEAGLELWDKWSSKGMKFKPGLCQAKWATFKSDGGITIATLFDLAIKNGWRPIPEEADVESISAGMNKDTLMLPGPHTEYSACAHDIFTRMKSCRLAFIRGGKVHEVEATGKCLQLNILTASALQSRIEKLGKTFVYTSKDGKICLAPKRPSREACDTLLETKEARQILEPITNVFRNPILVRSGNAVKVLGPGYHAENGGVFITAGAVIPEVGFEEACSGIGALLDDFLFVSDGDKSRMRSAILTFALRAGGIVSGNTPIHAFEATDSQTGKGYACELICGIYNEPTSLCIMKKGGVGSFDESLAERLLQGRPLIQFDNLRGHLDSQFLEAVITAPGDVGVRTPHKVEVHVDVKHFFF